MQRVPGLRSSLATVAVLLSASLLPLAAAAADRSTEGGVVVLATHGATQGIGSGTVIAKAGTTVRVLTAAHVATFGALALRLGDGSQSPAHLLAVVPGRDLAVIEADLAPARAAELAPAELGRPASAEAVHVWGSGNDGPAYETATVSNVGGDLPDGAPRGRYALGCALCHQGDSGAGIFNARGQLVGVYIGYFEVKNGRVSVAELPANDVEIAALHLPRNVSDPSTAHEPQVLAAETSEAR